MTPPSEGAPAPVIPDWCELIANAVEQLVEAFDQLQLPLREVLFLPLQRLPFFYQRAKRSDERVGHESLNASQRDEMPSRSLYWQDSAITNGRSAFDAYGRRPWQRGRT